MKKKPATPKPEFNYGSYDSYKLTDEQIRQAVQMFGWDFLQEDTDDKAGVMLALLRCFTLTTDAGEREGMLIAAESVLMPVTRTCESAMTKLAIKSHQRLIREGGIQ